MSVYRSFLFAPGNHPRRVEKALSLDADATILDLEDACPIAEKVATRAVVVAAYQQKPRRGLGYVRVNAMSTEWGYGDFVAVVQKGVDGIILPKLETVDEIRAADWLVANLERERGLDVGSIDILPIIETGKGLANIRPICAAGTRMKRIAFGDKDGVLRILPLPGQVIGDGFHELMRELCILHHKGWVPSTRLDRNGILVPCNASNCNGNTLESLLGIRSNGYSQPDFRGWEIKARQVTNADRPGASVVTLFTPEPTSGVYMTEGVAEFLRRYGYPDTQGRDDRLNFGGIYRINSAAHSTLR